jgi:acetyl-CoA acetyltransferase
MRMDATIAGVGMTRFGKHMETGLKALGAEAVQAALADSGLEAGDLEAAYVGNAAAGLVTGQECIRGQVILRSIGLGRLPVINVENACASASTALHQACAMVTAGLYDVVLALGVEKLYHEDKRKSFSAFSGAVDVEAMQAILAGLRKAAESGGAKSASSGAGEKRSMFMDIYAAMARGHMQRYGTTVEQFAGVSAKNSHHGSLNPRAQFREEMTIEQVLAAPMIAEPLTRPMCSPIGDGAAAVVVVSASKARQLGLSPPVRVAASVLHSGWDHGMEEPGTVEVCAHEAYEEAGVGPGELDVGDLRLRVPRALPSRRGRQADRRGRDAPRRAHPRQHLGRVAAQGPSRGRDGHRPDRGAHRAAPGALRAAPGGGGAHRAGTQRGWQHRDRRRRHVRDRPPAIGGVHA